MWAIKWFKFRWKKNWLKNSEFFKYHPLQFWSYAIAALILFTCPMPMWELFTPICLRAFISLIVHINTVSRRLLTNDYATYTAPVSYKLPISDGIPSNTRYFEGWETTRGLKYLLWYSVDATFPLGREIILQRVNKVMAQTKVVESVDSED